jgi:L-galactono-1,4-lactone dehydrogenase
MSLLRQQQQPPPSPSSIILPTTIIHSPKQPITNWSKNHSCLPQTIYTPTTIQEVEQIIQYHHHHGIKLRCVGARISPNGLGLANHSMLSFERLDSVINVDAKLKRVTAQAGVTVKKLLSTLAPYKLTLQNLASINDQQLGGFFQVGAHGTGAFIPTVEEQVVELTIVTPSQGIIHLNRTSGSSGNNIMFSACNLGLGLLGAVVEFTIQCVDMYDLIETTQVMTRQELRCQHSRLIMENQHCKYMWIPHTDGVVVVTANPTTTQSATTTTTISTTKEQEQQRRNIALSEMKKLFLRYNKHSAILDSPIVFADLRALLLSPTSLNLNSEHVREVNRAELKYHQGVVGTSIQSSEKTLAFDCGGQQLVMEFAVLAGEENGVPNYHDVDFVLDVLQTLEDQTTTTTTQHCKIPAPAPIEHRWTSGSTSFLSPVPKREGNIWGWIGIVMYLTIDTEKDKEMVINTFRQYRQLVHIVAKKRGLRIREHWAKIEPEITPEEIQIRKNQLMKLYDWSTFRSIQQWLDPKNILMNDWAEQVLPLGRNSFNFQFSNQSTTSNVNLGEAINNDNNNNNINEIGRLASL